ncbi:MAG: hypothetical protein ABW139_14985 [Candidatus Thiodiazotropha sp. DIVDIV]
MEKFHRIILGIELLAIALPVTLLLLIFGVPIAIKQLFSTLNIENSIVALISLLAVMATSAVWFLSIERIRGYSVFNKGYALWWWLVGLGIVIVLCSLLITRFTTVEPYSEDWWFYDQLGTFSLGAPLAIPTIHVTVLGLGSLGANK